MTAICLRAVKAVANVTRSRLCHVTSMVLVVVALAGCALGPPARVAPVSGFQLDRYLGTWYEIARLDHRFERDMTDVSARYSRNPDGSVRVLNRGYDVRKQEWREAEGRALFIGAESTGSLKVSFFGPFFGGYHVAALDPDYRWSLVIGPEISYAWILAREKTLPAAVRDDLIRRLSAVGIDPAQLIWVSQQRSDPTQ